MLFPKFGQAVILIYNCLTIDKEEITVLFPRKRISSAQNGQVQNGQGGGGGGGGDFGPMMQSSSHICN